jgi:hypothetical protein
MSPGRGRDVAEYLEYEFTSEFIDMAPQDKNDRILVADSSNRNYVRMRTPKSMWGWG